MLVHRAFPLLVALLALAACAPPEPPPLAPVPEPEPEEVEPEPAAPVRQQIPIEERIRAPFAVQSDGRPAPREPRRGVVVLDEQRDPGPAVAGNNEPDADAASNDPDADAAAAGDDNGSESPPAASPPSGATAAAPSSPPPASAGAARRHVVQAGETFFAIARRYDVTPMALAAANPGVDNQRLRVGQVLRLPEDAAAPRSPAAAAAAPAAAPSRPASQQRTHRVVAGETLWSIARRYGVSMADIRAANRMSGDTVRTGQTLVIPNR